MAKSGTIRTILSRGPKPLGIFREMLRRKRNKNPEIVVKGALCYYGIIISNNLIFYVIQHKDRNGVKMIRCIREYT
jgi:hypothetical protein